MLIRGGRDGRFSTMTVVATFPARPPGLLQKSYAAKDSPVKTVPGWALLSQEDARPAAADCPVKPAPDSEVLSEEERADKIAQSLRFYEGLYSEAECQQIEGFVDATAERAASGKFSGDRTVNPTPKRTKYFFGCGYTYGAGNKGKEELLPLGQVDPIPAWVQHFVILPLVQRGVVPQGWIDSVVMNDYQAGGSIVAHVDPLRLFERPILSTSFFCPARLVFGASFDPERKQAPVYMQPLTRGSVLVMAGYAANKETHGMRPEDMFGSRRVSIVLRRVLGAAPRVSEIQPKVILSRTLDEVERRRLIRQVQGRWHDPSGRFFYDVQSLSVRVSELQEGSQESKQKATWRITPKEHGLICNGGSLDPSGVSLKELRWYRPQRKPGDSSAFVWIREEDGASTS